MDIHWVFHVHGGSFFKDMDSLVRDLLTKRLEKIAPRRKCRGSRNPALCSTDKRDIQYGQSLIAKPRSW